MDALPTEIWFLIFEYATKVTPVHQGSVLRWERTSYTDTLALVRDSTATKKALILTCKRWMDFVKPSLHEWIILRQPKSLQTLVQDMQPTNAHSRAPGEPSPWSLTKRLDITLHTLTDGYDSLIATVLSNMPNLQELNFALNARSYIDYPLDVAIARAIRTCSSLRILNWYTQVLLPMPRGWHDILAAMPLLEVTTCVHSLRTWPYNDNPPVPLLPKLTTLLTSAHCNGCLSTTPCAMPALRNLVYSDRSLSFNPGRFRADQTWRNAQFFEQRGKQIMGLYLDADEDGIFLDKVVAHCSGLDTLHMTVHLPGPVLSREFPPSVKSLHICNQLDIRLGLSLADVLYQLLRVMAERPAQPTPTLRTMQLVHLDHVLNLSVVRTQFRWIQDVELQDCMGRAIW